MAAFTLHVVQCWLHKEHFLCIINASYINNLLYVKQL